MTLPEFMTLPEIFPNHVGNHDHDVKIMHACDWVFFFKLGVQIPPKKMYAALKVKKGLDS